MDQLSPLSTSSVGAAVDIRALRHRFGGFEALKSVDIAIRGGEFVALLGPSGCGKTTLLRCIAGLVQPTSGEILIDGEAITRIPVHKRHLGMVFQSYALFPHMTVGHNVRFGLKMQGIEESTGAKRIAEALALVRMQGYEERYPAQLSGGQQQRVALARALVTHPKALLLDEPFGALDAKLRESMQIELRRLQKSLGITTIFVTHDQQEALTIADRIAVMNDGRIEQFDSPDCIYNAPETLFVADFIGQTNRLSARAVGSRDGRTILSVAGSEATLECVAQAGIAPNEEVVAMIRPEHVRLVNTASMERSCLTGRVLDMVFVGEKQNVYVETPAGVLIASVPNLRRGENPTIANGGSVGLAWEPDNLFVLKANR
jgi:putative spermidine/putrescine transport system ATP-binding protein